ncbi:hypothetical protein EDD85DRAFT_782982 [Armillaria nabsnona]|nr:hypothetical protein EDD85DRAFT_782982 [Armillaria nabsnona]
MSNKQEAVKFNLNNQGPSADSHVQNLDVKFAGTQIIQKKGLEGQAHYSGIHIQTDIIMKGPWSRQPKTKTTKGEKDPVEALKPNDKPNGWIWITLQCPGMTDDEVLALEIEEVERDWWLEQWELKIAEFLQCIWSFEQYAVTWAQLASMNYGWPGYEVQTLQDFIIAQQAKYKENKRINNLDGDNGQAALILCDGEPVEVWWTEDGIVLV